MPTLFKRSNGVYYFITYTRDGRRRWVSTGERQKSDALRKLPAIDHEDVRPKRPPRLSIYIRDFLSFAASIYSPGSVGIYKKTLTHFLRVAGDLEIPNISARHIDLYRQRRLGEVSPVTLNIELRTLRAAFSYAVRWEMLKSNPFSHVPLCRIPECSPAFFSASGFQALVSAIKGTAPKIVVHFGC